MKKNKAIILMSVILLLSLLLGGCSNNNTSKRDGDYGDQGEKDAITIATTNPFRGAYSEGEKKTATWLINTLNEMGYSPETQSFQTQNGSSQNIVVNIPGRGFTRTEEEAKDIAGNINKELEIGDFRKTVIIGAGYGTPLGEETAEANPKYGGISDNASGTAALLQIARNLKRINTGYDVVLVFFGASSDSHAGARSFLQALKSSSDWNAKKISNVFVIDSIYAGNKLYANAGYHYVGTDKQYEFRHPLYLLLDISVSTFTGLRMLDNQSGLSVDVPNGAKGVMYREFTLKDKDNRPFDDEGLPIVYIESGEYDTETVQNDLDNTNSFFDSTKGKIRGTAFDSIDVLKDQLPTDTLKDRINTVAFLITSFVENGLYNADEK